MVAIDRVPDTQAATTQYFAVDSGISHFSPDLPAPQSDHAPSTRVPARVRPAVSWVLLVGSSPLSPAEVKTLAASLEAHAAVLRSLVQLTAGCRYRCWMRVMTTSRMRG